MKTLFTGILSIAIASSISSCTEIEPEPLTPSEVSSVLVDDPAITEDSYMRIWTYCLENPCYLDSEGNISYRKP